MSVILDAKMTGGNGTGGAVQYLGGNATTISSTGMTVGAGATLLVAVLGIGAGSNVVSAMSCTWNSVAMNLAAFINNAAGTDSSSAIFTLVNPANGNKTLSASWTGSSSGYMSAMSFLGTDTSTGYKSADNVTGTSTVAGTHSVVINTDGAGATIATICNTSGGVPTVTTQTQLFSGNQSVPNAAGSYALAGAGTNTHTFGGEASAISISWVGIHIIAPTVVTSSGLLIGASQGGF